MKKISIILVFALLFSLLFFNNCLKEEDLLTPKYHQLKNDLEVKQNNIKSREDYQAFMKKKTEDLEGLLNTVEEAKKTDSTTLLKGNILVDLKKYDKAIEIFESISLGKSDVAFDAKYGKLTAYVYGRKTKEALDLLGKISSDERIEQKGNLGDLMFMLSFSITDKEKQAAFMENSISKLGNSEDAQNKKAYLYGHIASIQADQGNPQIAINYLKTARMNLTSLKAQQSLDSKLIQLEMVGNKAPGFKAENWINSKALTFAKLKGKVVLIDFWAPWCGPCRIVIPNLVDFYNKYKKDGLVVIGITKLYGWYRDDQTKETIVDLTSEQETKLIEKFLKRYKIKYPIAVSHKGTPFETYGIRGIPTMIIIRKDGKVDKIQVGSGSEKELEEKVKELLK